MSGSIDNIISELIQKYGSETAEPYVTVLKQNGTALEGVENLGNARIENGRVVIDASYNGKIVKANVAAA